MALHLNDKWVWDFWFAKEAGRYHMFYLQAPRALKHPEIRHWHSSIGHAVSNDLIHWEILPDALHPAQSEQRWDSLTTWTGCTLRHDDTWYMFYTGTSRHEKGLIERIGFATSKDLIHWTKFEGNPVLSVDPTWYELFDRDVWYEETWRDPWIFRYEGLFHMLITARANQGPSKGRGIIGHCSSLDLFHWEVNKPLTSPGAYGYLEVPQLVKINDRWYLLFSVGTDKYAEDRLSQPGIRARTGTHFMFADNPLGPFTLPADDVLCGDEHGSLYSGKLVQDPNGAWVLMTVIQSDGSGVYVGDVSNPLSLTVQENGEISIDICKETGERNG